MHEPPLHHAHVRVLIYDYCEKTLKFVVNPGTLNMVTYFCRLVCVYVLHCTIYTWLLVIPLPVLGLALASFPLTGLCLPCGSGRVLYEVSVRRPLIPLCHLCTSTCLSLAPCVQTLIPLRQTSFS